MGAVTQSCPTLCNPMDCSLLGFSVPGTFQARILEWASFPFSKGSSRPSDQTRVSCVSYIGRGSPYHCAKRALNAIRCNLPREGQREFRHKQKRQTQKKEQCRDKTDLETWGHKPNQRTLADWKLEEISNGFSPGAARGAAVPPTPWFQPELLVYRTMRE